MANNLPQLKTDIKTAFGNNLDAATIQKLRNRFIAAYQSEWNARVASGTADNTANRNTFIADKMFDYIQNIFTSGSINEMRAAEPVPETIL
jgi:hypothetical protein